jgi:hypothetical protein
VNLNQYEKSETCPCRRLNDKIFSEPNHHTTMVWIHGVAAGEKVEMMTSTACSMRYFLRIGVMILFIMGTAAPPWADAVVLSPSSLVLNSQFARRTSTTSLTRRKLDPVLYSLRGGATLVSDDEDTEDEQEDDEEEDEDNEMDEEEENDEEEETQTTSTTALSQTAETTQYDEMLVMSPMTSMFATFGVMMLARKVDLFHPTVVRLAR